MQAPLIDSLLADIGIEGANLTKQGGLIREAADMQRIAERSTKSSLGGGDGGKSTQAEAERRRNPNRKAGTRMPRIYASSVIDAPAAQVWEKVRDFNALPRWHPRIRESRIENGEPSDKVGCVRDFRLQNGDRCARSCSGLSDYDMFCTYSILEIADAAHRLHGDLAADTHQRRQPHLHRVDGRIRLRRGERQPISSTASAAMSSRPASTH